MIYHVILVHTITEPPDGQHLCVRVFTCLPINSVFFFGNLYSSRDVPYWLGIQIRTLRTVLLSCQRWPRTETHKRTRVMPQVLVSEEKDNRGRPNLLSVGQTCRYKRVQNSTSALGETYPPPSKKVPSTAVEAVGVECAGCESVQQ